MISDFDAELFGSLWRVVPAVLALTFVVLLFAFRSVLIPVKAVLMNLLSVLGAYGFLVLVFQDGHGVRRRVEDCQVRFTIAVEIGGRDYVSAHAGRRLRWQE